MEATQMIDDSVLESEEDENEGDTNKRGQPLARLRILKNPHMPETEFPLFLGDNLLGRDASSCTLVLSAPSVSKQHANICMSISRRHRAQSEVHIEALVWDLGSMNGTRKGHLKLTPNVRYSLSEGDSLLMADIPCQYISCSAHKTSPQAETRTPLSQNPGVKSRSPDTLRENEGDTSTGSKTCIDRGMKTPVSFKSPDKGSCLSYEQTPSQPQGTLVPESDSESESEREGKACRSHYCLVSDSDCPKSSPNCSTFFSPANKTVPESEDESVITPSSSQENRPQRDISFTSKERDEDVGQQELHKSNVVENINPCEEEGGRQRKGASGGQLSPRKEDGNLSLSGEVESPVSNPVIPAFNMDSDTDVEGEEERVTSAGVESALPAILNTNKQVDRPPDTVQFHMDSDTDNGEDENEGILRKAPEALPAQEKPQVITASVITMESDTDAEDDASVPDAAAKVQPTFQSTCSADGAPLVQLKGFHLDSDTDAEEEHVAKPPNSEKHQTSNTETSQLDIKLIGPGSTSAAPKDLHVTSDTDDEAVPTPSANKPSSAAAVAELILATHVGAAFVSDSDTDDSVPMVTPPAVQTLAGITSEASQSDSNADTDVDDSSAPPVGNVAIPVKKVDSDTDVDNESMNIAGVDQTLKGEVEPGMLANLPQLKCSTPLQSPEEVAEMETQAFASPLSGMMRSPSVRPAGLSSFQECLADEDLIEAETQAFIPGSDHPQSRDQTLDLETTHVEKNQGNASSSAESDSRGPQTYQTDEELAKCPLLPEKEEQRNLDLEATQSYISELCSSEDAADEGGDQNTDPTETEPYNCGIPSTIAMAETQLISFPAGEEITTTTSHSFSVPQTNLATHDLGATQRMPTHEGDNSDSEDSLPITRKRQAKKLHLEEESQELTSSELSVGETRALAPSGDDDDEDTDSTIGPRKRKAKPLQIENETQSLPCSEVSAVETQPFGVCKGDEDLGPGSGESTAKQSQVEEEQTLSSRDVSTLEIGPFLTENEKEIENKSPISGKRKEKRLHLTDEATQPLNDSDVFTGESWPPREETDPQTEEENLKQSENSEASTEVGELAEYSERQRKSLPSTTGKKGGALGDEGEEDANQTNRAGWKNTTLLQKGEDRRPVMEHAVNKSVTKAEEENLGKKRKGKARQEIPPAEYAERTRLEVKSKKTDNETRESEEEADEEGLSGVCERLRREEHDLEKEKKQERQANVKRKAKDKTLKELEVNDEEQKQDEQRTPARGRRSRRTAAQSAMNVVSTPDDVPAKRTRSRSNSSNSVSSERSGSNVATRGSKRREARSSGTSQTSTRRTGATGTARPDKSDVTPPGLTSTSISSNSPTAETSTFTVSSQNKGRGGKRREKAGTCSESSTPGLSQSPQLSAPKGKTRKTRKTEVVYEDRQSEPESLQPSANRGRRQTRGNYSRPSDKDHTDQGGKGVREELLLPKRNARGQFQKVGKSETEEALAPAATHRKDAKRKPGKRKQSECGSSHAETQAMPNKKTSSDVDVGENETVRRKAKGRKSVAARKKKEDSSESEASASSMEQDASEWPETPSNRSSRKRHATSDSSPSAKSLRSSTASPVAGGRRRSSSQTYRVLFTGMEDEAGERVLARLGGVMANGVADMNCLVTDKVRRTVKFLCAVAKGIPVVTVEWLEKSGKSGSFLSTNAFLVKDADQEKKFNFSLEESLSAASSQPLLQGYEIHVTKSVLPEPAHMREIIACSGATFLPKMPSSQKPHTVVISCEKDWPLCRPAVSASLPVVTAEFILTGILQQKIDFETHELSAPAPNLRPAGGRGRSKKRKSS